MTSGVWVDGAGRVGFAFGADGSATLAAPAPPNSALATSGDVAWRTPTTVTPKSEGQCGVDVDVGVGVDVGVDVGVGVGFLGAKVAICKVGVDRCKWRGIWEGCPGLQQEQVVEVTAPPAKVLRAVIDLTRPGAGSDSDSSPPSI